ncbi:phosphate/phosphite/phosphonate ABC transporter substrate-binding protein [Pseudanabaena sp. PCC 6802]|uniref:phosphate/phosphite/phosphonate ABC transporter substrate-binding protein n=1 Tax=Pseudanabaena sp. PCC 6802 TaxID=118173 RepID=UPI00034C5369|nr:PhnD/SsuA/transferrin family substrate-binding protein [Pseudanabaena sp. PCC 6802]
MRSRRLLLLQMLGLLAACAPEVIKSPEKLTIGVVSYDEGLQSLDRYGKFRDYLASQVGAIIELEPTLNELKAIERIQSRAWSLVFAPPGLAAIAISKEDYKPIFSMQGVLNQKAVIVVLADSPIVKLADVANKTVAIGQPGSATGYYLPIYALYGLNLAAIEFTTTPKAILEMVDRGQAAAGALSKDEFERYRSGFSDKRFRVLHTSELGIPPGSVLVSPKIAPDLVQKIVDAMKSAPPNLVQSAGYIANAPVPNYEFMIKVVERVRPIATRIRQKPAPLYEEGRN